MTSPPKIFALMYHDVIEGDNFGASGFADSAKLYKMDAREFDAHIEAIRKRLSGAPSTAGEILNNSIGKKYISMLTFDDGGTGARTNVAPSLERIGWKAHFFITTNMIGQPGFMSAAQIKELRADGHIIGSHSHTHPNVFSSLGKTELMREWRESLNCLSDILGENVDAASVPGGYSSMSVYKSAAEAGIKYLFTSEPVSSLRMVDGCAIIGRYSITNGVGARAAAAIAAGDAGPRLKQKLLWDAKKAAKTVGGTHYLKIRKMLLGAIEKR